MRRVLIIDDDTFYGGLVAKVFGQRHWLAVTCLNMEDALKEIEALKVDLIVTDIFMPGIGGIDGIPFLKSKAPGVPIIAMSGGWDKLAPQEAVKAAVKVGADGGLSKPIKGDLLDKILDGLGLGGTAMGEPNWPQTVNDVTDWDQVFDDPTNGLVAWIANADSMDLLRISAINMMAHLFQNTRTKLDAPTYQQRLKDIFMKGQSADLAQTVAEIQALLREIKAHFKEEDAHYITEKRLENFEKNRAKRRAARPVAKPKPWYEKYALPLGTGGMVALAALGWVLINGDTETAPTAEKKITQTERKMVTRTPMGKVERGDEAGPRKDPDKLYRAPEGGAEPWRAPAQKFERPADAPPDMPAVLALSAVERNSKIRLPLIEVSDFVVMAGVCDRVPELLDLINIHLMKIDHEVEVRAPFQLTPEFLVSQMNRHLGQDVIRNVRFLTGDDLLKANFINDPCRPLTPKEIGDLYPANP